MSLPDKCPFCGASVHVMEDGKECRSGVWVTFDCHTSLQTVADPRRFQSSECEVRERLRLAARVAELEARCKRLEEAGDAMLSAWLMPEDSMSYSDWVCLSSDAKSGWYAAKEAKP